MVTLGNESESLDYKIGFDQINAVEGSFLNLQKRNKHLPILNS